MPRDLNSSWEVLRRGLASLSQEDKAGMSIPKFPLEMFQGDRALFFRTLFYKQTTSTENDLTGVGLIPQVIREDDLKKPKDFLGRNVSSYAAKSF